MKNIFKFRIILFILPVFLFTCEDNLDEEQELIVLTGQIDYTSEDGAFGALIGAYEKFQSVGWEQIPLLAVRGDDVNAGGLGDQQGFADTDNYIYDNNYWMYNSIFENWSQDILQITSQIESLERFRDGGVNSALIDQYIAECKVLRGFITLELSRLFGDVYKIQTTDQTQIEVLPKDELMVWISTQSVQSIAPDGVAVLTGTPFKYITVSVGAIVKATCTHSPAVTSITPPSFQLSPSPVPTFNFILCSVALPY